MKTPSGILALLGTAFVLSAALPAFAHHSFAMFDHSKTTTLDGTVKEFQWTNPHSWIQVLVKDESGKTVEWSVEAGSPNGLSRQGWKRYMMKAGDHVVVVVNPLKDGTPGGSLVSMTVNGGTYTDR